MGLSWVERRCKVGGSQGDIWSLRCSHQSGCVTVNKDRRGTHENEKRFTSLCSVMKYNNDIMTWNDRE